MMITMVLIAATIAIGNGFVGTESPEARACAQACSDMLKGNYDMYAVHRNEQGQWLCRCFPREIHNVEVKESK